MSRKVILYIAMSLDGYLAKSNDNIDFLTQVERPGEDYGYADFLSTVDTVIWGRRTYEKVLTISPEYLHQDKQVYVLSQSRTGQAGHVTFVPDVQELITTLKAREGKDIYCDGGGEIVAALLRHGLIDRLIVSVIPHLLGEGIRLFRDGRPEQALAFKRSISYPSGLVQLWYDKATATPAE
ncbi:dihydrofolate reductase family protein [Hymenobacter sp. ASUV-10]|uniref:Dihydrofolate reductase family protein n=1 Tax=Hymenobacter aranciens TaxID=3063996 RepID=A0ABT9BBL3_9BACT|nr:dihydrofolate reductase family protein [Hymenobacter sp. ASUV-10]MDO7875647.1 dihydrofolate reductase family protein [Hymenobacter sp. ASUV-10]